MILVDTSVWIDHLRRADRELIERLENGEVVGHPYIVGELACGNLASRASALADFDDLPQVTLADPGEVRRAIERRRLHGRGLGYVDVHLLVSVLLTPPARLWSRDKRLSSAAAELGIVHVPTPSR